MNNPLSLVDPSGYAATPDSTTIAEKTGGPDVTTVALGDDDKLEKLSDGRTVAVLADGTMIDVSSIKLSAGDGSGSATMTNSGGSFNTTVNTGNGDQKISGGTVLLKGDGDSGNVGSASTNQTGQTQSQAPAPVSAEAKGNDVVYTNSDGSTDTRSGGSRSWRNNNPGNMIQADGDGSIGSAGGSEKHPFAVFPSEKAGTDAAVANLRTSKYQALTIADAIKTWAPSADGNDPVHYANTIATWTGIAATTKISSLTETQLGSVVGAIQRFEGWTPGTVTSAPPPPH